MFAAGLRLRSRIPFPSDSSFATSQNTPCDPLFILRGLSILRQVLPQYTVNIDLAIPGLPLCLLRRQKRQTMLIWNPRLSKNSNRRKTSRTQAQLSLDVRLIFCYGLFPRIAQLPAHC